jgi:acyl-coenzyme A thioesterase PaaI-like protein
MDPASLRADGWTSMEVEGFSGVVGPLWVNDTNEELNVGFLSNESHANRHMGTVHGGLMMTFADIALGYAVVRMLGAPRCATVQLQMQFVASPQVDEFISCRPEIVRRTGGMVFVRGLLMEGDRIVANADGIWKILQPK